jgi:hypothetical protein
MHYISNLIISKMTHFKFVIKVKTFFGLGLDKHTKWNTHVELIIPKMRSACYAIRSIHSFSDKTTLKMVYIVYFHLIMEYVTIFWGKSSDSRKVFSCKRNFYELQQGPSPEIHVKYILNIRNTNFTISIHSNLNDLFDS